MRGIEELDQGSSDDVSNSEAIGASTAEEINPKSTDRAPAEKGRIRRPGGGCKKLTQKDPRIIPAIEEIIGEPDSKR